MKRTLRTEGDGKAVRRVARTYQASAIIRADDDGAGLELSVDRDGEWRLAVVEPGRRYGSVRERTVASGVLDAEHVSVHVEAPGPVEAHPVPAAAAASQDARPCHAEGGDPTPSASTQPEAERPKSVRAAVDAAFGVTRTVYHGGAPPHGESTQARMQRTDPVAWQQCRDAGRF